MPAQAFLGILKRRSCGWKKLQNKVTVRRFIPSAMYATGEGVGRDDKKAFRWFQKAADQGSARAQYRLGLMYDHGPARARTLPGPFNGIAWRRSKETLKHM
jgi:hypothetical protein